MKFAYQSGKINYKFKLSDDIMLISARHTKKNYKWRKRIVNTTCVGNRNIDPTIMMAFTPGGLYTILYEELTGNSANCLYVRFSPFKDEHEPLKIYFGMKLPFIGKREFIIVLRPFIRIGIGNDL